MRASAGSATIETIATNISGIRMLQILVAVVTMYLLSAVKKRLSPAFIIAGRHRDIPVQRLTAIGGIDDSGVIALSL